MIILLVLLMFRNSFGSYSECSTERLFPFVFGRGEGDVNIESGLVIQDSATPYDKLFLVGGIKETLLKPYSKQDGLVLL